MDRLRRLVFSFYREDPEIEAELEPLRDCRMSRSWGTIRVECVDAGHLEAREYLLLVSSLEPKPVDKVTELHQI